MAPGSVQRIYITHGHSDHCFGLPGLMCEIGTSNQELESSRIVHIVGPRGLRNMLPATLLTSSTFTPYRFRVDELWPAPNADGDGGGGGGGGSEGEGS